MNCVMGTVKRFTDYWFRWIIFVTCIMTITVYVIFNGIGFTTQIKEKSHTLQIQLEPEACPTVNSQTQPEQRLKLRPQKVDGMDIFVYTAVAVPISSGETHIRIQAFRKVNEKKTLQCCFKNKQGVDVAVDANIKYSYDMHSYRSTAFNCVVDSADVPKNISLSDNCLNGGTVIGVSPPEKPSGSISVCFHAMYGFPDPQLMTEWFEFMKLQGVGRVFIYPISHENFTDERSLRVLRYYEKQGLVNLIPYELRQYSPEQKRFHKRTDEMYSDEILPVFDCMVRSSLYKYTLYIDYDEVIMFQSNPLDLLGNLDKLLKENPKAGMFVFKMESFVLNWTATHDSDLIMMKYVNRTEALNDRKKMAYVQGRYGGISPHAAKPASGYTGMLVPESIGAIHHYRTCRLGWSDDYCMKSPRFRDDAMLKYEPVFNTLVKRVPEYIRTGSNNSLIY